MQTKKRALSNSAAAAVKAALAAAAPPIDPPDHVRLREKDMPFWRSILPARARDEWTKSDLVVAAQLARCQSDIETESELLESEGSVIENARGSMVMNPRHSVLEQLSRRELALMRALQLVGVVVKGDPRDLVKARKLEQQASAARSEMAEDDLLAT